MIKIKIKIHTPTDSQTRWPPLTMNAAACHRKHDMDGERQFVHFPFHFEAIYFSLFFFSSIFIWLQLCEIIRIVSNVFFSLLHLNANKV